MRRNVSAVLAFAFLTGCFPSCERSHSDMTPEEVVEAYLDIALNMKDIKQKADLMEYTTGNLRSAIERASDEIVREAYIEKNYLLERYSVVERRDRTPKETEITFQLSYKELGKEPKMKPEDAVAITTENTVSVVKLKDRWFLRDVLNKKSSFDFPLAQGSEIKPSPPGTPAEEN